MDTVQYYRRILHHCTILLIHVTLSMNRHCTMPHLHYIVMLSMDRHFFRTYTSFTLIRTDIARYKPTDIVPCHTRKIHHATPTDIARSNTYILHHATPIDMSPHIHTWLHRMVRTTPTYIAPCRTYTQHCLHTDITPHLRVLGSSGPLGMRSWRTSQARPWSSDCWTRRSSPHCQTTGCACPSAPAVRRPATAQGCSGWWRTRATAHSHAQSVSSRSWQEPGSYETKVKVAFRKQFHVHLRLSSETQNGHVHESTKWKIEGGVNKIEEPLTLT